MRTLALLAALLLLAFQVRAQTLQETADQVPAQDEPEVKDQDQPGDENEDIAVFFTEEERFARQARGIRKPIRCSCHRGNCSFPRRPSGTCWLFGRPYTFCCQ